MNAQTARRSLSILLSILHLKVAVRKTENLCLSKISPDASTLYDCNFSLKEEPRRAMAHNMPLMYLFLFLTRNATQLYIIYL